MDQIDKNNFDERPEALRPLKDNSGFKLPPNYFAEMQASILDNVAPEPAIRQRSSWDIFLERLEVFRPQHVLAGLATLLAFGLFIFPNIFSSTDTDALADLDDIDFEYFLNDELENLEGEDLIAILTTDETDILSLPIQESSIILPENIAAEYILEIDESELIEFSEE